MTGSLFPQEGRGLDDATSFIRVFSLSIAFYDWALTLPAEWRFYRGQRGWPNLACILFILIRYISIAVLVVSNIGYFADFFTHEMCAKYFIAAPILKVFQTTVSQTILAVRTINISRRKPMVMWIVGVAFLVTTVVSFVLNLWNRSFVQSRRRNCTAGSNPAALTVWPHYVVQMCYDILMLGLSSFYLISYSPKSGKVARLVRIMLTDGLVFFVALTGINAFNIIMYREANENVQTAGVSLGYAITWIMSQRILIHLRDAAADHNRPATTVVVSRPLTSAISISNAMRSQFETKDGLTFSISTHSRSRSDSRSRSRSQELNRLGGTGTGGRDLEAFAEETEAELRVQIEESVTVRYEREAARERESYRTPRIAWASPAHPAAAAPGTPPRRSRSESASRTPSAPSVRR